MPDEPTRASEPRPVSGPVAFEEGDFHALSGDLAGDAQYNDRRLATRRKVAALGKRVVAAAAERGWKLESRTSLHHPHAFNGMRVRRIWAYLTRPRAERRRLRGVLGAELGKDLDAAYRNAYVALAIESEALEVALRIHPDAWYDGQNLLHRVRAEGSQRLRALLNEIGGWRLRLDDWKGEWRCGELEPERLDEYLAAYTPGEHALAVERRWPAPAGRREHALTAEASDELVAAALRLEPLARYAMWSAESDFLLSRSDD